MNKIFSMSAYGKQAKYFIGAKRQTELANKYYPDWQVRIYTDSPQEFKDIESSAKIIHIDENTWGPFWRFDPLFENKDNITIVRDSDDRITVREVAAVKEWLESDKTFHIIKDHDAHFEFPIMAGLFGFKGMLDSSVRHQMNVFKTYNQYYLSDQIFLRDHVYPIVYFRTLFHSLNEGWFSETRKRLINPYCFCGNGYDEQDIPIYPASINLKIDYSKNLVFDGGRLTDLS
jgi:hypothetical protein